MALDDFDFFEEEEEEQEPEPEAGDSEKPNRTFIILVGALGGLLAIGICAFAIWMIVVAPRMRQDVAASNQAIEATNEAVRATTTAMAVAAIDVAKTEAAAPTEIPQPTIPPEPTDTPAPTEVLPTATVESVEGQDEPEAEATESQATESQATESQATESQATEAQKTPVTNSEEATPRPTATRRATATVTSGGSSVPETGVGVFGAALLGLVLVAALVFVRHARRTV